MLKQRSAAAHGRRASRTPSTSAVATGGSRSCWPTRRRRVTLVDSSPSRRSSSGLNVRRGRASADRTDAHDRPGRPHFADGSADLVPLVRVLQPPDRRVQLRSCTADPAADGVLLRRPGSSTSPRGSRSPRLESIARVAFDPEGLPTPELQIIRCGRPDGGTASAGRHQLAAIPDDRRSRRRAEDDEDPGCTWSAAAGGVKRCGEAGYEVVHFTGTRSRAAALWLSASIGRLRAAVYFGPSMFLLLRRAARAAAHCCDRIASSSASGSRTTGPVCAQRRGG